MTAVVASRGRGAVVQRAVAKSHRRLLGCTDVLRCAADAVSVGAAVGAAAAVSPPADVDAGVDVSCCCRTDCAVDCDAVEADLSPRPSIVPSHIAADSMSEACPDARSSSVNNVRVGLCDIG